MTLNPRAIKTDNINMISDMILSDDQQTITI